jgi:short-subunit dehydrogenase
LGMARAFAKRQMKLVIADLDQDAMSAAAAEFRGMNIDVVTKLCDVSRLEDVEALADFTMETYGAVHVLCNNAGVGIPTPTHKMKLQDWKWIIDVDLWGPIYGVQTFLPLIEQQEEGHINSTSSMAGLIAGRKMGAYNVAKHGVVALMATLERELRAKKSAVTASVLCPGPIKTNISSHSVEYRPENPDGTVRTPKHKSVKGQNTGDRMEAVMAEIGLDPDEVGEMVIDAIARDKFWVLTHPRWTKAIGAMLESMRADQSLTKA